MLPIKTQVLNLEAFLARILSIKKIIYDSSSMKF